MADSTDSGDPRPPRPTGTSRQPPVRQGDSIALEVTDLAFGGAGVAHVEGFAVFVRGGLPGQTVQARIIRRKSGYAEAAIEEILVHSPDEVPVRCGHFGPCGGCLWQNFDYARQLEAKSNQVRDCLVRLGGLADPPLEPPLAAPETYGYRNKMEFTFSDRIWRTRDDETGAFGVGLHVRGRFDKVLNQRECQIAPPWMAEAAMEIRELAEATGLPPYFIRESSGFFRFLVLREGFGTGERMVHLITWPAPPGSREETAVDQVLSGLHERRPGITSLVHGVTGSRANVAFCESHRTVIGPPVIHERLLGHLFEIGPNTFFQTNTRQAERLFELALAMAGGPVDTAWDLYCGVGALTLPLARQARQVVGAELIAASVEAAWRNAAANGVANAAFVAVDMRHAIRAEGLVDGEGRMVAQRPDLVLVDPPRDGLHADVAAGLVALAPPRIVYVSCNPSTLARDSGRLTEGGYRLERARAVDMFPQTAHVEMVALFTRG